jgi:hypothetical protein
VLHEKWRSKIEVGEKSKGKAVGWEGNVKWEEGSGGFV